MQHVAILRKGILEKIVSGEKTIESRWYKFPKTPYGKIAVDDIVFFKESGKPLTHSAVVGDVMFFDGLDEGMHRMIIDKYGARIGIGHSHWDSVKGKNYVTLIFLKDIKPVEPFSIDKKGFGNMSAWITVDDIGRIKKN